MDKYIVSLQGITYEQWVKLKIAIDRQFDMMLQSSSILKMCPISSVHNLDVNRINSPVVSFVINMDVIQPIESV
mgnify:CR=1 FL=1